MAKGNFYWFRFMQDFYAQREIKRLKTPLNREIYLRMCAYVTDTDDFTIVYHGDDETIADEIYFDCDIAQSGGTVEDVKNVIAKCLKLGLLSSDDPEAYLFFPEMPLLTGKETKRTVNRRKRKIEQGQNVPLGGQIVPLEGHFDDREEKTRDRKREEESRVDCAGLPPPPTPDDVKTYFSKTGNPADPEKFYDVNTARGWKVGGDPIVSWQALADSWGRTERQNTKQASDDNIDALLDAMNL